VKGLLYLWTFPTTSLGLAIAFLSLVSGGRVRVVTGVLEVHGGFASLLLRRLIPLQGGASAMALGHVVIGRDQNCLDLTRNHERVHVSQAERWGPFFIPLYLALSALALFRGQDPYRANPFEREAYERPA
jgi:hypothetical protein